MLSFKCHKVNWEPWCKNSKATPFIIFTILSDRQQDHCLKWNISTGIWYGGEGKWQIFEFESRVHWKVLGQRLTQIVSLYVKDKYGFRNCCAGFQVTFWNTDIMRKKCISLTKRWFWYINEREFVCCYQLSPQNLSPIAPFTECSPLWFALSWAHHFFAFPGTILLSSWMLLSQAFPPSLANSSITSHLFWILHSVFGSPPFPHTGILKSEFPFISPCPCF